MMTMTRKYYFKFHNRHNHAVSWKAKNVNRKTATTKKVKKKRRRRKDEMRWESHQRQKQSIIIIYCFFPSFTFISFIHFLLELFFINSLKKKKKKMKFFLSFHITSTHILAFHKNWVKIELLKLISRV